MSNYREQPDKELNGLSRELEETFNVERTVFSNSHTSQVMITLNPHATALVRAARIIAGVITLSSIGICAIGTHIVMHNTTGYDPVTTVKLFFGFGSVALAVMLCFAAPTLVAIECRIKSRFAKKRILPTPKDLLLARASALLVTLFGGTVFLLF